jgi:integrase
MARGNISKRGKSSWRIKIERKAERPGDKPKVFTETVKGRRQDAERRLTELLGQIDTGTAVDPSKLTVAAHVRQWIEDANGSPKTKEGYRQKCEGQIVPFIGDILLQKLRPMDVEQWHKDLLARGSKKGRPLAPRTVGHAHRLLNMAVKAAMKSEKVSRNVVAIHTPPAVGDEEVEILQEPAAVLAKLKGHNRHPEMHTIATTALGTGMRRGELLAVQWMNIDLDKATAKVERSLEETVAGLRFKAPKTRAGIRTVSLPVSVVEVLRAHKIKQMELRMALGLGKLPEDALVFANADGEPMRPDSLSTLWYHMVRDMGLPKVGFHALRHTHASALIAAGLDAVKVSKRLGHSSPAITLRIYAHLFKHDDSEAAKVMDAVLG